MTTKPKPQPSQVTPETDLDWRLCVPLAAIPCDSIETAELALAALAALDNFRAGAIITLDGRDTAVAYLDGSYPDWPDVSRTWLSGRAARHLNLPNPLRKAYGDD